MSIKVNSSLFFLRAKKVIELFEENSEIQSIAIIGGTDAEDDSKMTLLHTWIFGYELTETLMIFGKDKQVKILTSEKKIKILDPLLKETQNQGISLSIIEKKRESDNTDTMQELITFMKEQGESVGTLTTEKHAGTFAETWDETLKQSGLNLTNASEILAKLFAIKDEREIKNIKSSAAISSHIFSRKLINMLETVIDEEKEITHLALGEAMEKLFEDPSKFNKKLTPDMVESPYIPVFQSGPYDLSPYAENDKTRLKFGTIICSLGTRYLSYCSTVSRSFLVNPSPEQEDAYMLLLEVHAKLLKAMKPGVVLGDVYASILEFIRSRSPELEESFVDYCGWSTGINLVEKEYKITKDSQQTVSPDMCFVLRSGFQDLTDPKTSQKYSLMLCDTILITADSATSLTDFVSKKKSEVIYFLEEEKPSKASKKVTISAETKIREAPAKRQSSKSESATSEEKRKQHQAELEEKSRREILERLTNVGKSESKDKKPAREIESYSTPVDYPMEVGTRTKIYVDLKRETIVVPIYGMMVPFSVATIKNASKTENEFLRINFITPDTSAAQFGLKKTVQMEEGKKLTHVKELTYRIMDEKALNNTLRLIKELRKRITSREKERQEKSTLVKQDKLVLAKGKNPRLNGAFVRPNPSGRRTTGSLECHTNGLRFTSIKNETIDIIFNNIKHAFFQPAENELVVLIHFNLHSDIMVGKKKTRDVQFCTEVMETSQNLDSRGRFDEEFDEEERERVMKARLNKDFQRFVSKVEEISSIDFDIPYRDLGFYGVPNRSLVFLQPTVHCLVNLLETPFCVIPLNEIEIAYFERVHFNLKNFDLVFIWKDYEKPVAHITSISSEYLENIREWLDSCQIKYYEGAQTLNWNRIMPVIREDPLKFHQEEGGWSFLNPESEGEGEGEGEDSLPDDDESFGDDDMSDSDDDEYSDSEDYSEEYSEEEESEEESEEEEGEDWDELERKAKEDDRKRREREVEDDRNERKKKNTGPPPKSKSAPSKKR